MTIEAANEAHHEKERLRAIAQMPEMAAFGPGVNPLSAHLMFEAKLSIAEALATVVAVRAALTEIGIAGFEPLIEGGSNA